MSLELLEGKQHQLCGWKKATCHIWTFSMENCFLQKEAGFCVNTLYQMRFTYLNMLRPLFAPFIRTVHPFCHSKQLQWNCWEDFRSLSFSLFSSTVFNMISIQVCDSFSSFHLFLSSCSFLFCLVLLFLCTKHSTSLTGVKERWPVEH